MSMSGNTFEKKNGNRSVSPASVASETIGSNFQDERKSDTRESATITFTEIERASRAMTSGVNRSMCILTDAPDNSPFNGDSIIGDKTSVTQWYELPMSIHNPTSLVSNTTFAIGTNTSEEIFAYLAVINEEGSFAMFCCSAIGGNYVDITIRGNPNTESRFKVYAGCYKPAWA